MCLIGLLAACVRVLKGNIYFNQVHLAARENFLLYANRPFRECSFCTLLLSQLAVGLNSAVFKDTAPCQNQSDQKYSAAAL